MPEKSQEIFLCPQSTETAFVSKLLSPARQLQKETFLFRPADKKTRCIEKQKSISWLQAQQDLAMFITDELVDKDMTQKINKENNEENTQHSADINVNTTVKKQARKIVHKRHDLDEPRLVTLKQYPAPLDYDVNFITTSDNIRIRYAYFKSFKANSRGTILLLQGRTEFIEKYFEVIHDLQVKGFNVLTFDWRGQGLSQRLLSNRLKGYVRYFDHYLNDFNAIYNDILLPDCPQPHYMLCHSMGGMIGLMALRHQKNMFQRAVFSAPMLALNKLPFSQKLVKRLSRALIYLGMGSAYVTGSPKNMFEASDFFGNPLTSHHDRFIRMVDYFKACPELIVDKPTNRWLYAACQAMDLIHDYSFPDEILTPSIFVSAMHDQIVRSDTIEELAAQIRSAKHISMPEAQHELLMEKDVIYQQMLSAIDEFFNADVY